MKIAKIPSYFKWIYFSIKDHQQQQRGGKVLNDLSYDEFIFSFPNAREM